MKQLMKFRTILITASFIFIHIHLDAQMISLEGQRFFGHEWIDYNVSYYKITIGQDGIYEIGGQTLIDHGIDLDKIQGNQISIFHNGALIPISVSSSNNFTNSDFIRFKAFKNRGEVDRHLYADYETQQLNPAYSLITDSSAYFLCIGHKDGTIQLNEITNNLTNAPQAESYYFETIQSVFHDYHFKLKGTSDQQVISIFDTGEGFGKRNNRTDLIQDFNFQPNQIYHTEDIPGEVSVRYTTNIEKNGSEHEVGLLFEGQEIAHQSFEGLRVKDISGFIENNQLSENLSVQLEGQSKNNDYLAVSTIELKYPRKFIFNQSSTISFDYPSNNVNPLHFLLNDFDGEDEIIVWDVANNTKMTAGQSQVDNSYSFVLPQSTQDHRLICFNEKSIQKINKLDKRDFKEIPSESIDYAIISHPFFNNKSSGINPVEEYVRYRSSAIGGGFRTAVYNIDELTDMFAYGIHGHPLSVRNFIQYLNKTNSDLKNVLLLGKGRVYNHPLIRGYKGDAKEPDTVAYDFIPTYGSPGSDVLLACDLSDLPLVPIGRISSINKDEIDLYLDKVKQHEALFSNRNQTIEEKAWLKEAIHLSGGDPSIFAQIRRALSEMGDTLKTGKLGGNVTTFLKESTSTIQKSQSQALKDRVNEGVSILTFFGHSNYSLLDFNVDDVENYDNTGRYHMFIAMGCYAGNTFNKGRSNSEKNTLVRDKGAILYLANSTAELIPILKPFAIDIYQRFSTSNYGLSIGEIIKNASIDRLKGVTQRNKREQIYSLTFQGDPAIKYPLNPGPDYVFDHESVRFFPNQLNAEMDSFELSLSIVNLGANLHDSMLLNIQQKLPNGEIIHIKNVKVEAPANRDTVSFFIPINKSEEIVGLNTFFLTIDSKQEINELPNPEAESNNELYVNGSKGIRKYISANDIQAIYPENFGIVNNPNLQLSASSDNAFAQTTNFVWEMDTSANFDSPSKLIYETQQAGGVINWKPSSQMEDNVVYYWRVSKDSTATKSYSWKNRSFIYLPNSSKGWNQSHHDQLSQDELINMRIDQKSKTFEFGKNIADIKIKNVFINNRADKLIPRWFYKNETVQDWQSGTVDVGVYISVINSITGKIMQNPGRGTYGNFGKSNTPNAFPFKTETESERADLINFIHNIVPDDHMVLMYTIQKAYTNGKARDYKPQDWANDPGINLMTLLESQGASRIRELETTGAVPYIIVFQKNNDEFKTIETIGNLDDKSELQFVLQLNQSKGSAISKNIGPAKSWTKFIWNPEFIDLKDEYSVDIIGIANDLNEEVLLEDIQLNEIDLSQIKATEYPYLKLIFEAIDTLNHTAVQLDYWRVLYEGLPDAAINPNALFSFQSDTLNQGDLLKFSMSVHNPTDYDMDSLLVEYAIIDENNQSIIINKRYNKILAQEDLIIEFDYEAIRLSGDYTLQINLNPNNDQRELIQSNNLAILKFHVKGDHINPILNVTFDGLHIMDGDLVSSSPEITISLTDENQFLALNDSSIFELYLSPDPRVAIPIDKNDPDVFFIPSEDPSKGNKNQAKIIIRKSFTDGTHYLKVRATDRSGNSSGKNDYLISFKVITKSAISNVVNYPNPFTSSTKFVYTLTGDKTPEYYMIRIMTVTGKVVKEISQEEIGPLFIGTHMTDYAWNGTDEWGDPLATGVYLYQFIARNSEGNTMELLETQDYNRIHKLNTFFKNGIGKMVLMR